jgi:hypothetical protein
VSIIYLRHAALVRTVSGLVLLGLILVGRVAPAAGDPDRIALVVAAAATPHARELASTAISAVTRQRGFVLVTPSFTAKEVAAISECVTAPQAWTCIAPIVRGKGLHQVAVVSLVTSTSKDGSPMLVITEQILVASLDAAIGSQRFCVRCTDDVLVKSTSELTHALYQEIAVRSGRTVVAISSTPRGARITFDGESMGATDRSFNTFPGTHTLVLELDGYLRETRSVDAALDKTSELSVTLRPVAPVDPRGDPLATPQPVEPRSLLGPKLAIGVGAAAIVTGVVVLALGQQSETQPIGREQRAYYYSTTAPGIALVAGGAIVGVGGYLWWRFTKSTTAPTVAPVAGGAVIGITKAF